MATKKITTLIGLFCTTTIYLSFLLRNSKKYECPMTKWTTQFQHTFEE